MAQNPYEAPEAQLADPIPAEVPRPAEVARACRILWISLAVSVVTLLPSIRGQWWVPQSGEDVPGVAAVSIGFALVMFVLSAWLIAKTGRGLNWARWTLLVFFAFGWLFLLTDFPRSITETPLAALADTLICAAEAWACLLLFRNPGAAWFTRAR